MPANSGAPSRVAPPAPFLAATEEDTKNYGRRLAAHLPRPALIILTGDLGAGKTTLVKGLAEGLGVAREEDVASPSYTLIHEYEGSGVTLHHIDLYRLEGSRQVETLGLEDVLPGGAREASVVAIEWGAKFPLFRRLDRLVITLAPAAGEAREITADWRRGEPS